MNLLNKIGFYKTLRLLDNIDGWVSLENFHAKFNEDSYYNAFYRVKKALVKAKLIYISRKKNKPVIMISDRGRRVWALIGMITDTIGGVN